MVQEGYDKSRGSLFKIPSWMVVATSPSQIDEIRRADDDRLSPLEVARYAQNLSTTLSISTPSRDHSQETLARSLLTFRMKWQPLKITSLSRETLHFSLANTPFS
ncbi:hypothetical protein M378DRAFT_169094 [Amanita muscaria Koide BX008]|uniref:Uncharacterized protein n=1 Tax=Amanita muscaria (strain Koide BX008) TaxID=946122 RepID=A0A0C2SZM4_AMAMK|nr:hypothetical protein M378DRAFT_169094 [Amanita muscaria Koide BX008]